MLNLWRLRLLQELADLGSMTAVAEAMQLSRPAVSQQLAQLEREVGVVLLERIPRGVQLTAAGLQLAAQARELLAHVEAIEADVAQAKGRVIGRVRIASFGTFATTVAPPAVLRLQVEYPELNLSFAELEPVDAIRGVVAHQVDVAVVDDLVPPQASSSSLEYVPLMEDQFYVVLADSHRLAARPSLKLSELAAERWAINESAAAYHGFLLNACWEAGFKPEIVCSCRSTMSAVSFVRTGWAVAVLPGLAAGTSIEGVVLRPLEPKLFRHISAAVTRGSTRRPSIAATLATLWSEANKFADGEPG
ncbi:LysR family transcriptional regulator [Saccharopolyspora spinosa]|uniref:LysR family transcriptional regulator n=1 Tax=Saccharopolyspora spinosa TaxID=60894 RepID=A0A2N3XV53_SACSN|nr:LysR family transcriptional regulator [Saccharopolyspora spinosa]PKW14568.1 LysR family transcriptional regulator [Saccharopolyspora spinosa]